MVATGFINRFVFIYYVVFAEHTTQNNRHIHSIMFGLMGYCQETKRKRRVALNLPKKTDNEELFSIMQV
jgi:hypothetical protein